jgi:hypothetical protein
MFLSENMPGEAAQEGNCLPALPHCGPGEGVGGFSPAQMAISIDLSVSSSRLHCWPADRSSEASLAQASAPFLLRLDGHWSMPGSGDALLRLMHRETVPLANLLRSQGGVQG